jgi:prepilin-type processing-associated H-X9-DG protein
MMSSVYRQMVTFAMMAACGCTAYSAEIREQTSPAGTVSGYITLQGAVNHSTQVTFKLCEPGTTTIVVDASNDEEPQMEGAQVTTGSDGACILSDVPAGTYDMTAKGSKWLGEKQSNVVVQPGAVTNVYFVLRGGDASDSNSVNIQDLNMLKRTYERSLGQPGYDERADFDNSGSVDRLDLGILKSNYGKGGMEESKITACANNLRQLGFAVHMYANDFDGYLPGRMGVWSHTHFYPDYVKDKSVFDCPSNPELGTWHPSERPELYVLVNYNWAMNHNWSTGVPHIKAKSARTGKDLGILIDQQYQTLDGRVIYNYHAPDRPQRDQMKDYLNILFLDGSVRWDSYKEKGRLTSWP